MDKTIIVTGAASGIGQATVRRLVADGARVVLADCDDLSSLVGELRAAGGVVTACRVDVTKIDQVEAMVRDAQAAYGRIDGLVNCAGIVVSKFLEDTTEEDWDRQLGVNLKGVFLCCRAMIPVMRKDGGGTIVNIGSDLGMVGGPMTPAYCASKGGVLQLTRALAVDHAIDGIRVNCVCPGPVETAMLREIDVTVPDPAVERQRVIDSTLLKRVGQPKELAGVIRFMLSDDASNMTGSIVVADGGLTAI